MPIYARATRHPARQVRDQLKPSDPPGSYDNPPEVRQGSTCSVVPARAGFFRGAEQHPHRAGRRPRTRVGLPYEAGFGVSFQMSFPHARRSADEKSRPQAGLQAESGFVTSGPPVRAALTATDTDLERILSIIAGDPVLTMRVLRVVIHLVDHQQRELLPLLGGSAPQREGYGVEGTLGGRAFTMVTTCVSDNEPDGKRLWVPLLNGAERMGIVEVVSDAALSDQAVDDCVTVASLLAELVITRGSYSDTVERVRRRETMQLAAEMLRAQLPPLSFSTGHLMISGIMEPSYDVGGDAFDYAVNGDPAHLALFDAAGHGSAGGMRAVVLASIALAAYRNARRAGMDLTAAYHHIDRAVRTHDHAGMITAARRKIWFSCSSSLLGLRSSRSSADSIVVTPGRTPWSVSAISTSGADTTQRSRSPSRPERPTSRPYGRRRPHHDGTPVGTLSAWDTSSRRGTHVLTVRSQPNRGQSLVTSPGAKWQPAEQAGRQGHAS